MPPVSAAPIKNVSNSARAVRVDVAPFLLALPAWIPLIASIVRARALGLVPTGFVQYDMACYVANARQHFANGFHFTYSNPFAPYGSPAIYFQPHIFLLGLVERTGLPPGIALNLFGIVVVAFTAWVAAALYREVAGWETAAHKIGLVIFFWGGGVLSLAGLIFCLPAGMSFARASLVFDPMDGWWFLNFGRNLVYPTEAYYHGVFLLAILMLIRRKVGWTLALSALLSASHPYAGLSLALVLATFGAVELISTHGSSASKILTSGAIAITALHLGYYMIFLRRFPDHRALQAQWELDWSYMAWTFGPALYLVGFLALMRLTRWRDVLPDRNARLFLIWFAVIFGLTQHDLFVKPMQPIHFARGYDWIALFFLAAPAIVGLIEKALKRPVMVAVLLAIFLFDNIAWFVSFRDPAVQRYAIALTHGERDVLNWLSSQPSGTVVSDDLWIDYLTPAYSNSRAWFGHDYNTPHAEQRRKEVEAVFRGEFTVPASPAYYVPRRTTAWTPPAGARQVYANAEFSIWLAK